MDQDYPLSGVRIHLSGSIHKEPSSAEEQGIKDFVAELARLVFSEGGTLIHGSHPTLVESLGNAIKPHLEAGGSRESLILARSLFYALTKVELEEIAAHRKFAKVELFPFDPGRAEHLEQMRDWMADRCDAIVAVGGRGYDVNKAKAGVPMELKAGMARGKPCFVVGGFGGAAASFIQEPEGWLNRLRNGLDRDGNRSIFEGREPKSVARAIVDQLKRLPIAKKSIAGGRMFRILALDGGGVRGAFTAAVLAKWAEMMGRGGEENLIQHFDLVSGTSTGAILAIGLALGHPPTKLLEFYKSRVPDIFPSGRWLRQWFMPKYDLDTLVKHVSDAFGPSRLLRDSLCRLVIPTIRADHGEAELITTPHAEHRTEFHKISAATAAVLSAAAPTYFDSAELRGEIANHKFVDGGLWANNPTLPAIAEAVGHLGISLDRIDVLSVGTLTAELDFRRALDGGKLDWAAPVSDYFSAAQQSGSEMLAEMLLSSARYLRVNDKPPQAIDLADASAVDELARRGERTGAERFREVQSRFLDGYHARGVDRLASLVSESG